MPYIVSMKTGEYENLFGPFDVYEEAKEYARACVGLSQVCIKPVAFVPADWVRLPSSKGSPQEGEG